MYLEHGKCEEIQPTEFTLYLKSPRKEDSLRYKYAHHFALRKNKIVRIIESTKGKRRRKEEAWIKKDLVEYGYL